MGERAQALALLLLISACVPPPASPLHRWAELEVMTNGICHYGNRADCCWGWRRETWGECRPVCESGCKHGECVGPDQCRCHPGYTGKTCNQDVNECGLKPRPCKHRCINMVGTYKCYCLNGYMMMPDGTCRNGHTCAMANCQYGCAVMKGEVVCQCPSPGLQLGPDGKTCVDIDECFTGVAKCPRFRKCVNTFGSYLCKCHKGFELRYINGKYQCTDKKEHSFCRDKPDSKNCKCKFGTNGWRYDCTLHPVAAPIFVTVDPARPPTTPRPTTQMVTFAMMTSLPTTTRRPATSIAMATTTTTTTMTTSATTTSTTTATSTAVATAEPTTVTMTTPTTVSMTAQPTTVTTGTEPTTVAITTPTTIAMTTIPTPVPMTTELSTTSTVVTMTSTAMTTTTTSVPPITTTLDNRIWDITQRPRGDVHIPRNLDQNMFEYFDIELGNTAEFARDNPSASSLSCSFDQGMCRWMSDQEGDLPWETVMDPTGGRYLSVPEPKTIRSFRGARLSIPLAPPTLPPWKGSDLCLAFKHNLQGHLIGSLQLFVRKGWGQSPAIWTRTGGPGWRHTQITLWRRGIESVVFKAERRRGRKGEIAIDDVSLHRGACSTNKRE